MRIALEDSSRQRAGRALHDTKMLPAPIGGLSSDASIAKENPGAAEYLENFIPTTKGVRPKGGSIRLATVGSLEVETLMVYAGTTGEQLFAASNGKIYDCTAPASPFLTLTDVFSGQTSNKYSYVNFATAGGDFLLAFNGEDDHIVYDGAAWAVNTPAITGVDSADIVQAHVHGSRIWMVKKNSKKAWYLPVDSIGGAALDFSLEGIFQRGGKLLFIASWSQDSGSGSSDRILFVSDRGEIAGYTGDDPGSATTWAIFGKYDIAKPLGRFAFEKVGGDLLIETVNGIVAMSEVTTKDPAALTATAITKYIEPEWKRLTLQFPDREWTFVKWDQRNLGIVAIPGVMTEVSGASIWGSTFVWGTVPWGTGWTMEIPASTPQAFVVNLQTGRWSRITGWDCRCTAIFNGEFVFGTSGGTVVFGDKGGSDEGNPYECKLAYWPSRFGHVGDKEFLQASAVFEHSTSFNPKVTISTNNKLTWASPPSPPPEDNLGSAWDSGTWDNARFDGSATKRVRTEKWVSLGRRGRVGAVMLQMTFNNATTPDVEFTDVTVTFEKGAVVT